ncbi:TetR/AcrR family transcriptional regulator [Sphaerotilus microaerophilus]|nr:TetR/AcrR family transcriptional regulator [Sphaerotilus sp. FB-5]
MTSRQDPGKTRYHHGDLRAALLAVGDELLDEGGPVAVTLREAARRLGVSATATYRHFRDRDAYLGALAVLGFEAFGQAMNEAFQATQARADASPLQAMGLAYVRFAVARPGRFRLMFGPAVADRSAHPALQQAIEQASLAFRCAASAKTGPGGPTDQQAVLTMLKAWALVHGLSQLVIDGMLPGQEPEMLARAVLQAAPSR